MVFIEIDGGVSVTGFVTLQKKLDGACESRGLGT